MSDCILGLVRPYDLELRWNFPPARHAIIPNLRRPKELWTSHCFNALASFLHCFAKITPDLADRITNQSQGEALGAEPPSLHSHSLTSHIVTAQELRPYMDCPRSCCLDRSYFSYRIKASLYARCETSNSWRQPLHQPQSSTSLLSARDLDL